MHCVIAIFAAQNDRTRNFPMAEFSMRAFATGQKIKTRGLEVRNQLPNFTWHMQESIILQVTLLLLCRPRFNEVPTRLRCPPRQ